MKVRYFLLFILLILLIISIGLWTIDYDFFVDSILHFYGKEDKIAIFKTSYLPANKYQILRYLTSVFTVCYFLLIPFLDKKITPFVSIIKPMILISFQKLKGIFIELAHLSIIEKYYFWSSLSAFTVLKIYFLITLPLFVDEVFSYLYFVDKGFFVTMTYYPGPNNHVAYNFVANVFDIFFSDGLLTMRLPSFLLSILIFIFLFVFIKRIGGFFIAISTTCILNVFFVYNYYSVSGRGYVLYLFCFVCIVYCLFQLNNTIKQYYILGYVLFCVLGMYTIPTFVYPLISCFVIGIISFHQKLNWVKYHVIVVLGTIVLYLPIITFNGVNALIGNSWVKSLSFHEFIIHFSDYLLKTYDWLWNIENMNIGIFLSILLLTIFSFQYYSKSSKSILITLFFIIPFGILFFQKVLPFSRIWIYLLPVQSLLLALIFNKVIQRKWQQIALPIVLIFSLLGGYMLWQQEFKKGFGVYDEIPNVSKLLLQKNAKKVFIEEDTYNILTKYAFLQNNQPITVDVGQYYADKQYDFVLLLPNSVQQVDIEYKLVMQNSSIRVYERLK